MDQSEVLVLIRKAFALSWNGTRYVSGYVEWKSEKAAKIAEKNLSDFGLRPEGVKHSLIDFVLAGGAITQKLEGGDFDDPYWYQAILTELCPPRGVFVKFVLHDDDPNDPVVHLVGAHRQGV